MESLSLRPDAASPSIVGVVVAEPSVEIRRSICDALGSDAAVRVTDAVADFDALLAAVARSGAKVVVARDVVLSALGERAYGAYGELHAVGGAVRILLLTECSPLELAHTAIFDRLWGCLRDARVEALLVKAITTIAGGEVWFSRREITQMLHERSERSVPREPERFAPYGVTRRELEVVNMIVHGRTNKEIAKAMDISDLTVKTHVQNILKKCGARRRGELSDRMVAPR